MADIHDVADYLIVKLWEAGERPSVHRLHKLLYYVQGWHLVMHERPLFPERFQAWIHGPISKPLFDRFAFDRSLYAMVERRDIREGFTFDALSPMERDHVDRILDEYAIYPTFQLMRMSREELPWLKARGGIPLDERSERELEESVMRDFFRSQMEDEHEPDGMQAHA
ncbi:Panacea domain-containing protein [Roseateles sp. UC29_93]|jgi:uncharacterized phage-associated protein|uniref:Panacea domain-containing protein n=1 Tax=Roseateles sp. UC29_93 TaxID=3350177 RepID=UPI00366DEA98